MGRECGGGWHRCGVEGKRPEREDKEEWGEGGLKPNANYRTEFSLPFGFLGHWDNSYTYPGPGRG